MSRCAVGVFMSYPVRILRVRGHESSSLIVRTIPCTWLRLGLGVRVWVGAWGRVRARARAKARARAVSTARARAGAWVRVPCTLVWRVASCAPG
eukprot:scaffold11494_cov41-Phaeocystis_antarctica.AAC.2